jgi:ABC-type nitrate/sulfonate/bicarbonate transport system substrate-binding protein
VKIQQQRSLAPRRQYRKSSAALGVVLLTALAASACSSSGSSSSAQSGKSAKYTLTVNLSTPNGIISADFYVAEALGYFQQFGLTVNNDLAGALSATNVAAGKGDLGVEGASAILAPTAQGHGESLVYETNPADLGLGVIVAKDSPYKTIEDLAGKTVAVLGVGSTSYGAAKIWSSYLVSKGLAPLKLQIESSTGVEAAQLANNTIQGAVGEADIAAAGIAAGQERQLVSGSSALARQLQPLDVVGVSFFGLTSHLKQIEPAITAFDAGLREADAWIRQNPDKLAAELAKNPYFKGIPESVLADEVPIDEGFFDPTQGYISQASWQKSLVSYEKFGIPNITIPGNSGFAYSNVIDMQPWTNSTALLEKSGTAQAKAALADRGQISS